MTLVDICETFTSIQGESTYAGLPCFFIRLAGCNLRCSYCDTPRAYGPGVPTTVAELAAAAGACAAPIVEITGGEPLRQEGFHELARELLERTGKTVLVETNGSYDISVIPAGVVAVMDIKCPGSGACEAMDMANIGRLRPRDEVKFVVTDRADYEWARALVRREGLIHRCHAVFFSPAWGVLDPSELSEWIVAGGDAVRLGLPLHKLVGVA